MKHLKNLKKYFRFLPALMRNDVCNAECGLHLWNKVDINLLIAASVK